jgi:hypothetical protein
MCGRYITKDQRALERELPFLDVKDWPKFEASYNIAPTQLAPVVIATPGGNVCRTMRFGLVPFFANGVPGVDELLQDSFTAPDEHPHDLAASRLAVRAPFLAQGGDQHQASAAFGLKIRGVTDGQSVAAVPYVDGERNPVRGEPEPDDRRARGAQWPGGPDGVGDQFRGEQFRGVG